METSNTRIKQLTVIAEALLTAAFLTACSSGNTSAPVVPRANAGSGSPSSDVFQEVLQLRPGASGTSPHAVAKPLVQRSPNVYVADAGNNAVYEILRAGGYTQMLTLGSGFNGPSGVAVDPKGDVFVADTKNGAVKEMLAVKGGIPKNPVIKTLTTSIPNPYNVALDYSGNLFVTNNTSSAVFELLAPKYATIKQYGSFTYPTSVAVDGYANVYVGTAASTSEIFEMLAPSYSTVQTLGGGYGRFLNPYGLAVDDRGNVYVGDYNNSAFEKMPPNCFKANCVQTLTSKFYRPVGVAVDRFGNVYGGDAATGDVFEMLKQNGYKTINLLGAGFKIPWGIALH